ncbi:c-type cytochrome [Roseibium sediminis]|uniref:c-type cytochrome n=1 Tax=Roseibium sediminis TaxID=1775174 RepID=UPI001AD8C8F9|nr:c-type cytochrome [Roseibium sediminis]
MKLGVADLKAGRVRRALLAGALFLGVLAATHIPGPAKADWPERLEGHGGPVKSVVLEPTGHRLLSTSFDYAALVWTDPSAEGNPPEPLRLIGHEAAVNDGRFLNGNRAVTVGDDSDLILWDLASGTLLHRFEGKGEKVLGVDVSPDSRYAAVASWENEARVYDLSSNPPRLLHVMDQHRGNVNAVAFSSDGRQLFTASYDGGIRQFDVETGTLLREIVNFGWGVNVLKVLPNGKSLLFGVTDGKTGVLDIWSGEETKILPPHSRPVLSLAVSADGKRAASGGGDGIIRVYDALSFELLEEFENPYGPVWGLAFTADGKRLFYAGLDDGVHLWNVSPRKPFEALEVEFPRRFQVSDTQDPGERQFARKCSVCHTLTPDGGNRAGPTLYGVFGRKVGGLAGYPYSKALLDADFIWNEKTISDLFDHGPDVVTPGSKMPIQRLKSIEDRDALVAFLKRATDPKSNTTQTHNDGVQPQ